MSRNIWVISDTHFNHQNIIEYTKRPFKTYHEMNECILNNWNSVVKDGDIVYHLGDVYMSRPEDANYVLSKLKGRKRLILGNHDDGKDKVLWNNFQKILMWRYFKEFKLLLTHVPVHPNNIVHGDELSVVNVHGHIHEKEAYSKQYKNVCVERINYTPVNIEELKPIATN